MLKLKRVQGIKDSRGQAKKRKNVQTLIKTLNYRVRFKEVTYGTEDGAIGDSGRV
jgi:hypothetical protein